MSKALCDQTIAVAPGHKVLKAAPDAAASRTDPAQQAVDDLNAQCLDVAGAGFTPQTVQVTEGGN